MAFYNTGSRNTTDFSPQNIEGGVKLAKCPVHTVRIKFDWSIDHPALLGHHEVQGELRHAEGGGPSRVLCGRGE